MNSISLKEAAAFRGVSERRISQLANESGSGVWRVENVDVIHLNNHKK